MDTNEMKYLVEKFYNGETSSTEERILFDYFSNGNVDKSLLEEKEIFLQMMKGDNIDVPPALETKLNTLIDHLAHEDEKQSYTKRKPLWRWSISAVAGIALLIVAGIHFIDKQENVMPSYSELTTEDQRKIEDAQKALLLLSSNFNKGISQVEVVSTTFDKTNNILDRTINKRNNIKL